MKKILFTVVLSISLALASSGQVDPNKNIDEGKIEGNTYTSNEIGWKMEIPTGWAVVEKEKTKENNEKGLKALQETMDAEVDYSGLKNLISIQKDLFNIFQSTSEPFKVEYEGEWEENSAALKEIIYLTYLDQGIKADSSATTTEVIDGLEFQKYSFTIYSPNGKFILSQIMYSRLINGFDFGVNINYNNDKYRDELLMAFRNSKFKKD
ncbi:hypothetical protein [Aquiflexum gelatinilyticum]|uniref:PsbP C-terminal domain-containing protein n=1 Tax=Aquiflexum gelatinilyticum TaxID=2961943 RepID=A0A9X2P3Q2_9BACT|nr:hypothetical protein [Aquiflexum gelatinilyticum]MCR9013498.1 hypothetical protein [Aquiflexum gelatinilyticum]